MLRNAGAGIGGAPDPALTTVTRSHDAESTRGTVGRYSPSDRGAFRTGGTRPAEFTDSIATPLLAFSPCGVWPVALSGGVGESLFLLNSDRP